MGQAKSRGTFDERKVEAVAEHPPRESSLKSDRAKDDQEDASRRGRRSVPGVGLMDWLRAVSTWCVG